MLATENIEDTFLLPSKIAESEGAFMLRIRDDRMIEAGIPDNDYFIVRLRNSAGNSDIVIALLDDEATVKYFYRYEDYVELIPACSRM